MLNDEDFLKKYLEMGSYALADEIGINVRNVQRRRAKIEKKTGLILSSPGQYGHKTTQIWPSIFPKRVPIDIENGTVIIGSDAHYWPGLASTAHKGMIALIKELKPKMIILNGDIVDGAKIGRHARIGWASAPSIRQEKDAIEERLTEIEDASKGVEKHWTIGNHDLRVDTYLSAHAPDFEGMQGSSLKDHFPNWQHSMSIWINDSVVVKHRFKGGIHATHNNTLWSGKSIVTGHLHSLKVTPFDDYNGTRYGVDTGTMMDPSGPQSEYTEDNPLNHRSGFAVLTFYRGMLLPPELCQVISGNSLSFRGKVITV